MHKQLNVNQMDLKYKNSETESSFYVCTGNWTTRSMNYAVRVVLVKAISRIKFALTVR